MIKWFKLNKLIMFTVDHLWC